jgi:hypothetical protein
MNRLQRRQIEVFRSIADTEDRVARTFDRLAMVKNPASRERRTALAAQAREGAATARRHARELEAKVLGHPRPPVE